MGSSAVVFQRQPTTVWKKTPGGSFLVQELETEGFVGAVEWGSLVGVTTLQALVTSLLKTACNQPTPSVGSNRLVGLLHMAQLPEQ